LTPFDVYVYDMGRKAAETAGKTDVLVFHGSTGAPTVDVAEVKVGVGIPVTQFGAYLSIAYEMEQSGEVTIEIFNINGQKMMHSELGQRTSGTHVETVRLEGIENGGYTMRMTADESRHTSKIKVAN